MSFIALPLSLLLVGLADWRLSLVHLIDIICGRIVILESSNHRTNFRCCSGNGIKLCRPLPQPLSHTRCISFAFSLSLVVVLSLAFNERLPPPIIG